MSPHTLVRASFGAALALGLLAMSGDASSMKEVRIRARCEPTSFNAAVGPGTCIGDGNITFGEFIAELTEDQEVGAWRFNPRRFSIDEGTQVILESRAGETHTFTRVAHFGGGFIPVLNTLSGNPVPAPECAVAPFVPQPPSATNIFVPAFETVAGPTAGDGALPEGETNWQCCIHPWMRTRIRTK